MLDDPVQWGSRSWLPAAEGGSGVAEAGWENGVGINSTFRPVSRDDFRGVFLVLQVQILAEEYFNGWQ